MRADNETRDIAPRLDVAAIYQRKLKMLSDLHALEAIGEKLQKEFEELCGYSPLEAHQTHNIEYGVSLEKYVDRTCWKYLVSLFRLEAYMLCTDYAKMMKEIDEYRTPVFTIENAEGWLAGLKALIHDNMKILVKKVFAEITTETYQTGSGYNGPRKKRNNNGIDKNFILGTRDWQDVFGYYSQRPTTTDDLEKVCYILAGQELPEQTAKMIMRKTKSETYSCEWFTLKFCKNGNTHYTLADDVREKLNRYGPEGAIIGENIKIKIVERWVA